jgi:hypothetical protein
MRDDTVSELRDRARAAEAGLDPREGATMDRTIRALAIASVGALMLALAVAGRASPAAERAACGKFAGPAWTFSSSLTGEKKRGTKWSVTARGVPCSFALKTAKVLVKTPFKGEARTRLKSPKGWSCIAGGGNSHGGKATPGYCSQGSKSFSWGPALGA